MCLEIWIMRIAVSNVVSEYSLGGVNFTHRVRDMMFETESCGTGYEVRDMRCVVLGMRIAVRCEIRCYGDMVIWPALQARAFALGTGYEVRDMRYVVHSVRYG